MDEFRQRIAQAVAPLLDSTEADILNLLARPPRADMGDIALPCFQFAKSRRLAPPKIATEIAGKLSIDSGKETTAVEEEGRSKAEHFTAGDSETSTGDLYSHERARLIGISEVRAMGPYVNFWVEARHLARSAMEVGVALEAGELFERPVDSDTGEPPVLTIDYSSPNIAKEFSVAHLRSTALGHSLVELHKARGWRTIGVNHLGDWGTQFGLLINAYREKGDPAALEREPIKHLQSLYVDISQRAKNDPAVQDAARATFRALEEGDAETVALWRRFRDLSLEEFDRIYELLGVKFDTYEGESFYNDKMEPVFERLRTGGVAVQDQGAWIVPMGEEEAPLLLRKSDGASTYGMRDMAAMDYRARQYRFRRNVYVTDARQAQHFRQVFAAYARLGEKETQMAARCEHVPFGTVTVDGMAMSTREGNVILLEDYIHDLAERAGEIVREKNADLPAQVADELAFQVAVGALVFEMLRREQTHNVDFRREESLKFEGETGPRLQYLHAARLCSLLRTYPEKMGEQAAELTTVTSALGWFDSDVVTTAEEKELAKLVCEYPGVIERARAQCAPNLVISWLLELTDTFNAFYRETVVLDPTNPAATHARVAFIRLLREVVGHALGLVGIPAPERM